MYTLAYFGFLFCGRYFACYILVCRFTGGVGSAELGNWVTYIFDELSLLNASDVKTMQRWVPSHR